MGNGCGSTGQHISHLLCLGKARALVPSKGGRLVKKRPLGELDPGIYFLWVLQVERGAREERGSSQVREAQGEARVGSGRRLEALSPLGLRRKGLEARDRWDR